MMAGEAAGKAVGRSLKWRQVGKQRHRPGGAAGAAISNAMEQALGRMMQGVPPTSPMQYLDLESMRIMKASKKTLEGRKTAKAARKLNWPVQIQTQSPVATMSFVPPGTALAGLYSPPWRDGSAGTQASRIDVDPGRLNRGTMAHELGHHLSWVFNQIRPTPHTSRQWSHESEEELADAFAGRSQRRDYNELAQIMLHATRGVR